MASRTRWDRGGHGGTARSARERSATGRGGAAPRWTGDDILRDAAETFSLLPRPGGAAREAFLTLLTGYWPGASAGTRAAVATALRGSPRVTRDVLDALDVLIDGGTAVSGADTDNAIELPTVIARAAGVAHRDGLRVTAAVSGRAEPLRAEHGTERDGARTERRARVAPPALAAPEPDADESPEPAAAHEPASPEQSLAADGDRAAHARRVIAQLALDDSGAVPELQPERIERELEAAERPAPAIARLLDIAPARAAAVVAVPRARGTAVALRALGVGSVRAERLIARWRGRAPADFRESYEALRPADCLQTVAGWRRTDAERCGDNDGASDANGVTGTDGARRSA